MAPLTIGDTVARDQGDLACRAIPKLARNGMAQRQLEGAQLMVVPPTVNGRSPRSGMAQIHKLKVA